jgi:uncharacterized protein
VSHRLQRQGQAYVHSEVYSKAIPGLGFGLFTRSPLPKDEVIFLAAGLLMDEAILERDFGEITNYGWQVEDDVYLLETVESLERYANHSCNPNCGAYGQLGLISMRELSAGEQITFDYAMTQSIPVLFQECACGANNCRGKINPEDYLRPDLQQRYRGYFSPYLERKIRQSKSGK